MLIKNENTIIILSLLLFIAGALSINIYLPSLLHLSQVFHTDLSNLKLSIFLFLVSYAISQFFWGSLSEKFGRKKSLLIGLVMACIGTLITFLSPNVLLFNIGRLIEGFGIGSASVLARTILADSLDKTKITFAMSYVATAMNIMPALAPIIGGYLQYWFGWRSIFLFLFIYTIFLLITLIKKLPETHTAIQQNINLKEIVMQYVEVLTHRGFLGYMLPFIALTGGLLGYYAATPFIFISVLHYSAQHYGYLSIVIAVAYISGTTVSRYAATQLGLDKTILLGIVIALCAALISIMSWLFFSMNTISILFPMTVYALAAGLVSPCSNAGAMAVTRHIAGPSGAVLSASYYVAWAIFSIIITHLALNSLGTLAGYIGVIAVFALVGFLMLKIKISRSGKSGSVNS